jgi:antirestriction protein ArdC
LKIPNLYKKFTDSIIRDLEAGTPTWLKPWKDGTTSGLMPPQNAARTMRIKSASAGDQAFPSTC